MSTRMYRYNSNGAQNGASFPKDPNGGDPLFIFQVKIIQEASFRQLHRFPEISLIMIRDGKIQIAYRDTGTCLLYTSPSPRDLSTSRMPSSA